MKLHKNGSIFTFKLLMLIIALSINFMTCAMSSSSSSWYTTTLATINAMFFGSSKIHPTTSDAVLPPVIATLDTEKIQKLNEYFSDQGDGAILYPELVKFIKAYRCEEYIEKRALKIIGKRDIHHEYAPREYLSDGKIFIKGPKIDRIINAHRMKNYFKHHHFDSLAVVDKCLIIDEDSLSVVSENFEKGDQTKKISLSEIQQLAQFSLGTGYWDWQFGVNIIRDIHDKLVFLDTEDASFSHVSAVSKIRYPIFNKKNLMLHLYLDSDDAQKDAYAWIYQEYLKFRDNLQGFDLVTALSENVEYDDPGIDFHQVKREFKEFEAIRNKDVVKDIENEEF